ncbi:hypothetical protein MMK73_002633 [Providencia rettgeri]|nr:hypothetical protein [Providencia rettgeri]
MPVFKVSNDKIQKYASLSLEDMVIKIKNKPKAFEGFSYVVVNKIKGIKNNGDMDTINKNWLLKKGANDESIHKIDKYFNLGMKASTNYFSSPPEQSLPEESPPEQSLPAKKIQTEQKENILNKVTERKLHSDDLSNNSIKKNTPTENGTKNDEIIENMEHCEGTNVEQKKGAVREKINDFINELLPNKNKSNQLNSSEKEPKSQKILDEHTIEEAIKLKVPFDEISKKSLSLIEAKIYKKFEEMKLSHHPESFEVELLNAQEILKKYDNEIVNKKINTIINRYLDEYQLYIRENKSPISRIWYAINSVSKLQDVTPRKLNEFKMAIIDDFKKEPIENIEKYSSDLVRKISSYTHENIAKKVNDFITTHSIDRINELKRDEKFSVARKTELLEPKENVTTEELLKEVSLKKIISHVFKRVINNIRRFFSRN